MSGPLDGLTVVDLSTTPTGVHVGHLFADFGADVIGVEPPGGSPLRANPMWAFLGRGRRSIVLDLHDASDLDMARELAGRADVVVRTWRPGVAERLGLGYADLAAANPGLILTSITGFGEEGPHAGIKGYEGLVMAKLGAYSQMAPVVGRPRPAYCATPYASFGAAQQALQGTLAALHERERSGLGQQVDATLVQGIAAHDPWNWFLQLLALRHPDAFTSAPPIGDDGVPNQSFPFRLLVCLTADGHWLQFSQTMPHLFEAFLGALGLDWMLEDPDWSTAPEFDDHDRRVDFWERMLTAARSRTLAEWQAVFDAEPDIWAEVFRSGGELLEHPQLVHDGRVVSVDGISQPGPIARLATTPAELGPPAPALDADRNAVLGLLRHPRRSEPASAVPAPARAPALAGVTILELGTFYAAPFGATALAEQGARVIKVETLEGEPMRGIVGFPEAGGIKSLQGKESISLDLRTDAGREIVHELARRSDIVLQSFRAGVAERLGVDPATLRALNPDLVHLAAPGYGTQGPCGHRPAFAPTIGAGSGAGWRNAGPSVPERSDLSLDEIKHHSIRLGMATQTPGNADGCSAMAVATAMLLGLLARDRGAPGQDMVTSMLSTMAHVLCEDVVAVPGVEPSRVDPDLLGLGVRYRLYPASDGWVFLAAPTDREWATFVETVGLTPGADADTVAALFATRPADVWETELSAADVGCVAVARGPVERTLLDPEFGRASGFVTDVEHPSFGEHPRLVPLARLGRSPTVVAPGCLLGQHTDAILTDLGYDEQRIAALREEGVIGG